MKNETKRIMDFAYNMYQSMDGMELNSKILAKNILCELIEYETNDFEMMIALDGDNWKNFSDRYQRDDDDDEEDEEDEDNQKENA